MLVGHVSDEMYDTLADVQVEFSTADEFITATRSTPRGAIHADVSPGEYDISLAKDGYGSKTVAVTLGDDTPHDFRLLSAERTYGYAWPKWITAGEKGEYRVHTPVEEARVSLWRYGLNREHVEIVSWYYEQGSSNGVQTLPDEDFTQTGAQWRPHRHSFVTDVTAPEQSGLYFFYVETKSGDQVTSFPWVVAPRKPTARIAVLAPTNTWNAYNSFGGRSNYVQAKALPERPVVNPADDLDILNQKGDTGDVNLHPNDEYQPLSFERPCLFNQVDRNESVTDPIRGWAESHTAPAEWRALGWVEREGFEYDLYADYHLHVGELNLNAYDVLVLNQHSEYWSAEMYNRVKDWVHDDGGKLIVLGANAIDCEIEFLDETTMRCLTDKTDTIGPIPDPTEAPTSVFESRFHRTTESQGNLLGVITTANDLGTSAPYAVMEEDHWIFDGTDLENGDLFGRRSLMESFPNGASGDETDKVSRFAPDDIEVVAKGQNPNGGGADMVYFETESNGAVFCASSCSYAQCLLVSDQLSTITRNVFERFLNGSE